MSNFRFAFTDTTIQEVQTIIEAETQEEAEEKFGNGDWVANIKSEEVEERSPLHITQVGPETAQAVAWKNPLAVPAIPVFVDGVWKYV